MDRAKHPQHLDILTYMLFKVLVWGLVLFYLLRDFKSFNFLPFPFGTGACPVGQTGTCLRRKHHRSERRRVPRKVERDIFEVDALGRKNPL